jgi:hypothetical protein
MQALAVNTAAAAAATTTTTTTTTTASGDKNFGIYDIRVCQ